MNSIIHNIGDFIADLEKNEKIVCKHRQWRIENPLMTWVYSLFGREESRILSIAEAWDACLAYLEKIPVQFRADSQASQKVNFALYLKGTQLILALLDAYATPKTYQFSQRIKAKDISLKYRLESKNGGIDPIKHPSISSELFGAFLEKVRQWKLTQSTLKDKSLSKIEFKKILKTIHYPVFLKHLIENAELSHFYISWIFKHKNCPEVCIEYPHLAQQLEESGLARRIGRVNANLLKIQKVNGQKIVSLKMEGKDKNILEEHDLMIFRGNYILSIAEIFKIFSKKVFEVGNLELMKDGIINWNAHKLGYWDADRQKFEAISVDQPLWWKQLPLFEVLPKRAAEKRYGVTLDGKNWNIAATSTRETLSLDFQNSHAYQEIAVPINSNTYGIYAFGKFANKFPESYLESIKMLCHTVPATISFPDENVFYNHRQFAYYSFKVAPSQGARLMEFIQQDVLKSRQGNLVYQIESDNCALWSQINLEKLLGETQVPNLYRMNLLDTEPSGFVNFLFQSIKLLPSHLQVGLLTRLHFPLGAWKGQWVYEQGKKVWKSLYTHFFWETGDVYLPAFVHRQQEVGLLGPGNNHWSSKTNIRQRLCALLFRCSIPSCFLNRIAFDNQWVKGIKYPLGYPRGPTRDLMRC